MFLSETDTEVAAKLVGREYDRGRRPDRAMRNVVQRLEGAFTLLAVHADSPGVVVGARRNSPLVVGLGDGENFLGSDVAAFIGHTRRRPRARPGPDRDDHPGRRTRSSTSTARPSDGKAYEVDWDAAAAEKGGYATFMEKEIHDQPHAVADTLLGRTDDDRPARARRGADQRGAAARRSTRSSIVACGTAAYAGMVAKYAIEHWTPHPRRGRARPRVPLPRPDRRRQHARRLDQPVRRDDGHPDGRQARPRARRA